MKSSLLWTNKHISSVHCISILQEGYDHSYFTISTFVDSHIALHAKHLTS